MPNETWQSDFTHYRLTRPDGSPGADVEIITWLDDRSRYALHVTAHPRVTAPIVLATFREAADQHGDPGLHADRQRHGLHRPFAGGRGGRNQPRARAPPTRHRPEELPPNHPTTCGKVERFQQTMKNGCAPNPPSPTTHRPSSRPCSTRFVDEYNHRRPHRSLPHRATPATALRRPCPRPPPATDRDRDTHDRVRHDKVDKAGTVTLRIAGRLHHIGIGRTHAGTHVILLVQDLARPRRQRRHRRTPPRADPRPHARDYQPTGTTRTHPQNDNSPNLQSQVRAVPMS